MGEHTLHCELHSELGALSHQLAIADGLQSGNVTGMMVVVLLVQLLTRENSLGSVDDDDELATVNVGGVLGSVLAAKNGRCLNGSLTEGLTGRIDDVPFTRNGLCFCHKSRH